MEGCGDSFTKLLLYLGYAESIGVHHGVFSHLYVYVNLLAVINIIHIFLNGLCVSEWRE